MPVQFELDVQPLAEFEHSPAFASTSKLGQAVTVGRWSTPSAQVA